MAEGSSIFAPRADVATRDHEEARGLLDTSNDDQDVTHDPADAVESPIPHSRHNRPSLSQIDSDKPFRQSSFAQPRPDGTPRTPNRVRFDLERALSAQQTNGHAQHPEWMNEDDPLEGDESLVLNQDGETQRMPLLTDIEAPSVTVATDLDFDPEDHLENARPRSNMRSAFMNMANSIMYGEIAHHSVQWFTDST